MILTSEDLEKLKYTPRQETPSFICCVCKNKFTGVGTALFDPPPGYAHGGWFCWNCLKEGKRLAGEGTIVDQFTRQIIRHKSDADRLVWGATNEPA